MRTAAGRARGDRVAILAPQGLDYVAGFFAAIKAGTIAVPLFAPELPGHAERLGRALHDRAAVLTTAASAVEAVETSLLKGSRTTSHKSSSSTMSRTPPRRHWFPNPHRCRRHLPSAVHLGLDAPRSAVEITHRAVGTNLTQMILSIDLLDRNTHGVSWLPLYHDMGLSMIGFPTVYGGPPP